MNTGVQRSGATPAGASTANTRPVGSGVGNAFGTGKSLPLHRDGARDPVRRHGDRRRPARPRGQGRRRRCRCHGARYLHVLVPCPLGWGSASAETVQVARLATQSGLFPVFEAEHGTVTRGDADPAPGAGRGLPAPAGPLRAPLPAAKAAPRWWPPSRRSADRDIARFGLLGPTRRQLMKLPFAVTSRPRLQPRRPTGAWRTERAVYQTLTAPCGNACPAGEDVRTWLYDAESGGAGYEAAWRAIMAINPFPAIMRPRLLPPVRDRLQPRAASTRRSASTPSSGSSVTRRSSEGWTRAEAAASRPDGGCWSSAPVRPACPRRTTWPCAATTVTIRESAPAAGGMMRYGIPRYRLPREVLDAEIARVLALGVTLELDTPVTDLGRRDGREGWDAVVPGRRRPARAPHLPARGVGRQGARRRLDAARARGRGSGRCSAAGSRCTAAGTPPSTPLGPPRGSAPPTPWSSTGAPATGCPPTPTR